ncbi:putative NAD(P)H-binding protein 2 [Elsinoe fawcettii]|nr:putative NAD(P)H-binding protein 2 [Elsinoe fawcettii]
MSEPTTFALIGATGQTGRIVLRRLLDRQDIHINIYVRSKSKLLGQSPSLEKSSRVSIFEGAVTDTTTFMSCLRGASTVICTLGGNDNRPQRGLRDGATSIVSALTNLRSEAEGNYQAPHVLLLSSLTWNDNMQKQTPALVHFIISRAFWYPYEDLLGAHKILGDAGDLMKLLLIQPSAIVDDRGTGPLISSDTATMTTSYEDLAEAFVICATGNEWRKLSQVVVTSKGGDASGRGYGLEIAKRVVRGLSASYIPGFWQVHDWIFG